MPFTPLPALAFAAAATSTIRLSAYVLDNAYRHPILLAKEAATLEAERVGRVEESVEILRARKVVASGLGR